MKKLLITILLLSSAICNAQWQYKTYVDEFGDNTDDDYIVQFDEGGTFNNSAATNERLFSKIIIDRLDGNLIIQFDLYEYYSNKVDFNDDDIAIFKVKTESGSVFSYQVDLAGEGIYIFDTSYAILFIELLKKSSGKLKCYLEISNGVHSSTYNFKINPIGFTAQLNKLK